jgi:hypothetical protein
MDDERMTARRLSPKKPSIPVWAPIQLTPIRQILSLLCFAESI